jgi:beta-galactosidase
LEAQLIRGVFDRAGVGVEKYSDGFLVDWRDGFWVATNFSADHQTLSAPANTKALIGDWDVPPAGVTVWK